MPVYFAIPFVPRWRISRRWLAIRYRETQWTLLVGFGTISGLTAWLRAQSDPANLQCYLELCSAPMEWNKLSRELPLRLRVEKQTAYSNIPIGCDIQTWSRSYPWHSTGKLSLFKHSWSVILYVEQTYFEIAATFHNCSNRYLIIVFYYFSDTLLVRLQM